MGHAQVAVAGGSHVADWRPPGAGLTVSTVPFVEAFTAKMAALKMGDGLDSDVDVGPLVNAETRDKVAAFVADAVA